MDKIWNIPEIQLTSLSEVNEPRPVLLVTRPEEWEQVGKRIHLNITCKLEPLSAKLEHWDTLIELAANVFAEVVYAVGGRLVVDTAKYLAYEFSLPLVCVPCALDTDAFLTHSANVQNGGCVRSFMTGPAERVIVDFEMIASAPAEQRAGGLAQVLSLATAGWDWKLAEQRGKNPPGKSFDASIYEQTQAVLRGGIQCAAAAGRGEPSGLKQLLDCLCLEVQLRNQAGHDRPAKGSEHYFAYAGHYLLENKVDWQEFVGQGILLAAEWQGQDKAALEEALRAAHLPVDRLPQPEVERVKHSLPGFCKQHKLDYGIACEV
jgi:glycerol dehydrogenase-like iron-containing ADH family enzyme